MNNLEPTMKPQTDNLGTSSRSLWRAVLSFPFSALSFVAVVVATVCAIIAVVIAGNPSALGYNQNGHSEPKSPPDLEIQV